MNHAQARKLARPRRRSRAVDEDYFPLDGGLNLVDSELTVESGQVRAAVNYEMGVNGGYERVGGFGKYDGSTQVSDYELLEYRSSALAGPIFTTGETITGGTTLHSGVLLTQTNTLGGDNATLHNEDIDNATHHTPSHCTVTDGAYFLPITGSYPLVSLSEMELTDTSAFNACWVIGVQTYSVLIGDVAFVSCFARANDLGVSVALSWGASTATFHLGLGTVIGTLNTSSAGMDHIVDGVYRCWFVASPATVAATAFLTVLGASLTGIIGESLYFSGLQVIRGATAYRPGYAKTTTVALPITCGNLILYASTGIFTDDETLTGSVSGLTAKAEGNAGTNSEPDASLDAGYTALAVAVTTPVAPVGDGGNRGVWTYKGITYCLRDNVGATEGQLFKATSSGWVAIPMLYRIGFDSGSQKLLPGDAIDNGSGSTATVEACQITSGAISTGDAAGWAWCSNKSGTWANNEPIEIGATNVATVDGTPAVPTIPAGGKYEFRTYAFPETTSSAESLKERMYFVGGVGGCLIFDDTIEGAGSEELLIELDDLMPAALHPEHLGIHNEYLWLGFNNGSAQNSAVAAPLSFNPVFGASEINVGAAIIGFQEEIGDALIIFARNRIRILEGKSRATFALGDYNVKTGAHEWSIQRISLAMYFDDRGFGSLQSTDRYGDYLDNTVSQDIQPLVDLLLKTTTVRCSQLYKNRNIYRCFFADGTWVSIGIKNRKITGLMPCAYPDIVPNVCCSEEDAAGIERLYIGADDGAVYQQEEATSFDGDPIVAFLRPSFHHSGSPNRRKKYTMAELDAVVPNAFTISADFRYDDGRAEEALADPIDLFNVEQGGYWDEFTWDDFTWDEGLVRVGAFKLEGEGTNVSAAFRHSSSSEKRHTLRGITLRWLRRGTDRRTVHG